MSLKVIPPLPGVFVYEACVCLDSQFLSPRAFLLCPRLKLLALALLPEFLCSSGYRTFPGSCVALGTGLVILPSLLGQPVTSYWLHCSELSVERRDSITCEAQD